MANVIIAVLATILGYTTSAVITEVRGQGPAAAPIVAAEIPAQFRPIHAAEPPVFASTRAPSWNERKEAAMVISAARAFVVGQSAEMER